MAPIERQGLLYAKNIYKRMSSQITVLVEQV